MADQEALTMTKTTAEAENGGGGIEADRAAYERHLVAYPDKAMFVYWDWFEAERRAGDVDGQRRVLERWVRQLPRGGGGFGRLAWQEYLKFEVHNGGVDRVRAVGEGLVAAFPMNPHAYVDYVRALAALSRHAEAFAVAERGCKELSGWCRGHDEFIRLFMAKYIRRLKMKRNTPWEDHIMNDP